MKKVIYYHVYLTDNVSTWASIVMEQMTLMMNHDLLDEVDEIRINCISKNDERVNLFINLLNHFNIGNKTRIHLYENPFDNDQDMLNNIESDKTVTENITMRNIWNDCQNEDMHLLYIHTKGITSVSNLLMRGDTYRYSVYYHWRQFLNWSVIEKWKLCVDNLHFNDICGTNYRETPAKHFSGSFWWSKSEYIRKLPDPSTKDWWIDLKNKSSDQWLKNASDRFRDEQWPCSLDKINVYNLHTPKDLDAAGSIYERRKYKDDIELSWHPV